MPRRRACSSSSSRADSRSPRRAERARELDAETPQFLDSLRHPTGTLLEALQEADSTCDWRPGVPVHLHASSDDRDVPIANAHHCQELLEARRAETRLVDFGEVEHGTSVTLSLPKVLERFAALEG